MNASRRRFEIRPLDEDELSVLETRFPNKPHDARFENQGRGLCRYLIAWEGEVPAGFVLCKFTAPILSEAAARFRCAEVEDLFVHEDQRRRGVARSLMHAAEALAKSLMLPRMGLDVELDNEPARTLYRDLGYADAGFGPYIRSGWTRKTDGGRGVWMVIVEFQIKELR